MLLVDIIAHYVFFIKTLLILTAVFIIISGLDDLFIDFIYWSRTLYRTVFVHRKYKPLDVEQLYLHKESFLAVMVPAWQESGIIRQMIDNTLRSYDYKSYHLFIGAYQNDPATQEAVRAANMDYPNVHLIVVPRNGPTCKADCLNWILQGLMRFEQDHSLQFSGVVMHDAEDVVHRLELKLFNYLIDRIDLMQLPVFSLERPWYEFTSGHYIDEFAESHSKDLVVRETLTGVVPSAGVATCFSRRGLAALAAQNNNLVFNTDSLTEDYDISFRLKALGMKQIFLRYGVMTTLRKVSPFTGRVRTIRERDYVATREYFPNSIRTATRQKSRWILGIVFQGWRFIGWRGNLATRYMLFRDRKSVFTAFTTIIAYFILLHIVILNQLPKFFPDHYIFPLIVQIDSLPWWLLLINLGLLLNRIFHRMFFTGRIYGWEQALLSIPRMIVGNIVAFLASVRALRLFYFHIIQGTPLVWDKTDHAYPSSNQLQHMRQRLGELLLERKLITEHVLSEALELQHSTKQPLGEILLQMNALELPVLSQVLARHLGISVEEALLRLHASKGNI